MFVAFVTVADLSVLSRQIAVANCNDVLHYSTNLLGLECINRRGKLQLQTETSHFLAKLLP